LHEIIDVNKILFVDHGDIVPAALLDAVTDNVDNNTGDVSGGWGFLVIR